MRRKPQEWAINAPKGDPRIGYSSWECLAVCYGSDDFKVVGEEVGSANARLIAAAPDLIKHLRELVEIADSAISAGDWKVDGCCDPSLSLDWARAAIAKAEGRA
jgi:hypothetical protein